MSSAEPPELTDSHAQPMTSWNEWLVMQTGEPDPIGWMARFLLHREHGGPARLAFASKDVQEGLKALFDKFNRDTEGQMIEHPVEWTRVEELRRYDAPWRVDRAGEDGVRLTFAAGDRDVLALALADEQALRLVEDVIAAMRGV